MVIFLGDVRCERMTGDVIPRWWHFPVKTQGKSALLRCMTQILWPSMEHIMKVSMVSASITQLPSTEIHGVTSKDPLIVGVFTTEPSQSQHLLGADSFLGFMKSIISTPFVFYTGGGKKNAAHFILTASAFIMCGSFSRVKGNNCSSKYCIIKVKYSSGFSLPNWIIGHLQVLAIVLSLISMEVIHTEQPAACWREAQGRELAVSSSSGFQLYLGKWIWLPRFHALSNR